MGNVLHKQVYPGVVVPTALEDLEKGGFKVVDKYAIFASESHGLRDSTVFFFHGNLEDVSRTAWSWKRLGTRRVVGFEYPGYGWRGGEVASQLDDVYSQTEVVKTISGEGGAILVGRSLGSFGALNLAVALGPAKCRAVLLFSPLLTAVATKISPPFHRAFGFMDYADNESLAGRLHPDIPVFVAHGTTDDVVPLSNALALWEAFPAKCRRSFIQVGGAGHNDLFLSDKTWIEANAFLDTIDGSSRQPM